MHSKALTVDDYLAELPEQRRKTISEVRNALRSAMPVGYEEGMLYGMITYFIPLARYPQTYNGQPLCYVALASQKQYMSLYLMAVYSGQEETFRAQYAKSGKKLDMGKSCLRFKRIEDLAMDVILECVAGTSPEQFIDHYEKARNGVKS